MSGQYQNHMNSRFTIRVEQKLNVNELCVYVILMNSELGYGRDSKRFKVFFPMSYHLFR